MDTTLENSGQPAENVQPVETQSEVDKNYNDVVNRIGMCTNESREKVESLKQFNDSNDKLGEPIDNWGLHIWVAKTFLGWSDKPPVGNGNIANGGRFFSKDDKISDVFPNGIPENAKIYGVYFSLVDPDEPLSDNPMSMAFQIFEGLNQFKLNDSKIEIFGDEIISQNLGTEKQENVTRKKYKYEKRDDV